MMDEYQAGMEELSLLYKSNDPDKLDGIVEHMCKNLIGESVFVINYPVRLHEIKTVEVVITGVEERHLYGLRDSAEIIIFIPYNYIYHPAILAALKCL